MNRDWVTPPYHRHGLHQVEHLVPCALLSRGDGPTREFGSADEPLDWSGLALPWGEGAEISGEEFLARTRTDALLVMRGEQIVFERYVDEFTPATRHIVMSISKSFCGMLAGCLVEEGLIDLASPTSRYVPELADGSFGGAAVQELLDMTAAPHYDMTYLNPDAEVHAGDRAAGWRPRRPGDVAGTRPFLAGLRGAGEHGAGFQYCSGTTDVLAWVLERAAGLDYRELMARYIWSRIGAEADAFITVDEFGTPYACAGMGMRLRDLARFGRLVLDRGYRDGQAVLPASWIEQTRNGGQFNTSEEPDSARHGTYKNQWWVPGDDHGSFYGVGIFGQYLWLDPVADVLVAKFSAEDAPVADDSREIQALSAIARTIVPQET
ncbi:serine hydrolase domain-containing protein [Nonomuraea sediminis]|uniref:serine hydrolase domain-containing protein n=1 Tax=Nonomuraea sediminis TaxID=2835864 RepID=UPI001BDD981B|nr:serine hydrolase [Nonomuraea sediminis]